MKKLYLILVSLFWFFLLSACSFQEKLDEWFDAVSQKIELDKKLEYLNEQKKNFTMPSWVKNLNIFEPQWLELVEDESYKTSQEVEWFDSIRYVYSGDYETSMSQAEKIAQKAWIDMSEEFKSAKELLAKMWSWDSSKFKDLIWDLKWVVYSNYSLTKDPEADKIISISVEEDWTMEIVVTDRKNMQNIAKDQLDLLNK